MRTLEAVVSAVLVGPEGVTSSEERDKIVCEWDGVRGDRHCAPTKISGKREAGELGIFKGTEIRNLRQVTIVSEEELLEIAQLMEVPRVTGADVGANIVLSGVENLSKLPIPLIKFPEQAMIKVTGENTPCLFPGKNIEARYPDIGISNLASRFPKAAMGKRGLLAVVFRPGNIRKGDVAEILL